MSQTLRTLLMTAGHWCSIQDLTLFSTLAATVPTSVWTLFTFLSVLEFICPEERSSSLTMFVFFKELCKFGRPKVSAQQELWSTSESGFYILCEEICKNQKGYLATCWPFLLVGAWYTSQKQSSCWSQCNEICRFDLFFPIIISPLPG